MIFGILLMVLLCILFAFYIGYYLFGFRFGKNAHSVQIGTYLPKVSIVIATFNEQETVKKKIENTIGLNYPKEKMEIIFVDSSTDRTRQIIREFKEKSDLNIILFEERERKGLASALNTGYALASGEIVIKADCDLILDKNSVSELVNHFSDPSIGAVSGAIKVLNQSSIEMGYRTIFDLLRLAEASLDSTYLFNPLSAFRKKLIQPIDEKSVADDAELALKIRKNGYRTIYSPEAVAYEMSPTSFKERIKQKSRRAQGHIRLIGQNLRILLNPKYGKFGLIVFPANFFMMILSPWLILLTFVTGFIYLYSLTGALLSSVSALLFLALIAVIYFKSMPKMVAGFLDSQLNLLIGFVKLITKGPDFKWTKDNRHSSE
jgi:cellulose synthase/poly-beta-1,6-N-acetylglucosamine synthase-like glycosyltransferase